MDIKYFNIMKKKYIKTFESFKNNKNEPVNEEFLGAIGKWLGNMFKKYNIARTTYSAGKGTDDWYEHCGVLIRKMANDESNKFAKKFLD